MFYIGANKIWENLSSNLSLILFEEYTSGEQTMCIYT